jgi:hypothetical protein
LVRITYARACVFASGSHNQLAVHYIWVFLNYELMKCIFTLHIETECVCTECVKKQKMGLYYDI